MFNRSIALLLVLIVSGASYAHGDERWCYPWNDWTCVPGSPFSVDNVLQIHDTIGRDGPRFLEASWHETEPVLAFITGWVAGSYYLDVWRHTYVDGFASFVGSEEPIIHDPSFTKLTVTSDKIVVGTRAGNLLFWDLEQEKFLYELPVIDGWVSELLLHPSDEWLLAVIDYAKLFRIDLKTQTVAEITLQDSGVGDFNALAFSSDGLLLAAAGNAALGIWDTDSWKAWESRPLSADSAEVLIFADDDSELLTISYASVNRWSISDKGLHFVRKLQPYEGRRNCFINDGDISPDGTLLMTTDDCGQTRAWNLSADVEVFIPQLDFSEAFFQGEVIQFSPDGRVLFVGGAIGWDHFIIHEPE
ncbi:MAG: WD40 repeat domain-containing protein [Chloroflexi bacterium]|nr:WD40 repeat domain-containing protein [Chloroflexota bacterium]